MSATKKAPAPATLVLPLSRDEATAVLMIMMKGMATVIAECMAGKSEDQAADVVAVNLADPIADRLSDFVGIPRGKYDA